MIRPLKILLVSLCVVLLILVTWVGVSLLAIRGMETPSYTVAYSARTFELREYAPQIIAEVMIKAEFEKAIQEGSRILKEYFPGHSIVREIVTGESGDTHLISFVLHSSSTMESIPKPENKNIRLYALPAARYAAISFSGFPTEIRVAQQKRKLLQQLKANGGTALSEAVYVRHHPLYVIPFLMKHEVVVMI